MKQELILEQKTKPTKLSEAWRLASKELIQVKHSLGYKSKRTACALGALNYYFSRSESDENISVESWDADIDRQYEVFSTHLRDHHKSDEVSLNNYHGWTFEMFAEEAEKIGL